MKKPDDNRPVFNDAYKSRIRFSNSRLINNQLVYDNFPIIVARAVFLS